MISSPELPGVVRSLKPMTQDSMTSGKEDRKVKETLTVSTARFAVFGLLAALLAIAGCTGRKPGPGPAKTASDQSKSTEELGRDSELGKPVLRTINAVAVWPENIELLLGADDQAFRFSLQENSENLGGRIETVFTSRVNSIVVSPNRAWAAMDETGATGPIRVLLLEQTDPLPVAILRGPSDFARLGFVPGGNTLIMASFGAVFTVDLQKLTTIKTWRLAENVFEVNTQIDTDSRGPILSVSGHHSEPVLFFDLATMKRVSPPALPRLADISNIFRHQEKWFGFENGNVFDLQTGHRVFTMKEGAADFKLSPDGKIISFRSPGGMDPSTRDIVILEVGSWRVLHRLKPRHGFASQDFCFVSPTTLVNPGEITEFWNVRTGKTIGWVVPWANTTFKVKDGLTATRRDWAIALPDGRYYGSELAKDLIPGSKTKDPSVLRDFRTGLGIREPEAG